MNAAQEMLYHLEQLKKHLEEEPENALGYAIEVDPVHHDPMRTTRYSFHMRLNPMPEELYEDPETKRTRLLDEIHGDLPGLPPTFLAKALRHTTTVDLELICTELGNVSARRETPTSETEFAGVTKLPTGR